VVPYGCSTVIFNFYSNDSPEALSTEIFSLEPCIMNHKLYSSEGTIYSTSMRGTTAVDKTEKVGITLPISLVKRADKASEDVPRSTNHATSWT
jgi:hypothetical protein